MKQMETMILRFMIDYITEHGYSPSFDEIGKAVSLKSKSNVHRWIKSMIEKGILETDAETGGTPRAIRVPGYEFVSQKERRDDLGKHMWNSVEDLLPSDDRYILLSFENFSVPVIGRYEETADGGAFYAGDEDESLVSQEMFVNAWMELPERYKGE